MSVLREGKIIRCRTSGGIDYCRSDVQNRTLDSLFRILINPQKMEWFSGGLVICVSRVRIWV